MTGGLLSDIEQAFTELGLTAKIRYSGKEKAWIATISWSAPDYSVQVVAGRGPSMKEAFSEAIAEYRRQCPNG